MTNIRLTFRAWLAEGFDTALPGHPLILRVRQAGDTPKRLTDVRRRQQVRLATVRETSRCQCNDYSGVQ